MSRILLGSTATSGHTECSTNYYEAFAEEVSHSDHDEAFKHVYYVMVFVSSLWFIGKLFQRMGMPALVGEIIVGIIMGPNLLNIVGDHGSDFLIVIGEIGLIMLVVEAGIDVDIGMLKLIGPRGLGIAILGSFLPLLMGFAISMGMGESVQSSIAIGSCFAPTSMGIALNVLKKAKILNTPTGQLIIAAAILDDVIALIILSELGAMKEPTAKNIILPLIVSPVLILVVGYLSIRYIPKWIRKIMTKIPKEHHENAILGILFVATFVMIPACHYAGSSHLLGAFLAGLMFCTDHTIHHVWAHQIKRILYWMLRIFFACTIGFAIPIKEFTSPAVIIRGLIYCLCVIGKLITGLFGRPLSKKEFFTVGFSMSAWGEFAFIIATASYEEHTIDKEAFSAVLLAVLLSVIVSPYLLRLTLCHFEKMAQKKMNKNLEKYGDTNFHPVYFAINTKARGQWGHQDKLLHKIFKLELEIIDFRAWHAPEYNHSHHQPLTKESFYVMDQNLILPPTKHISDSEKMRLKDRVKDIRHTLKEVLGEKAVICIKRWLPGVLERDDTLDKKDALFGQHVLKTPRRPSYCRREAFKQAHSIMSSIDLDFQKEIERAAVEKIKNENLSEALYGEPSENNGVPVISPLSEIPEPMHKTRSVPIPSVPSSIATKLPAKVHHQHIQLVRHLSEQDVTALHSGAGHGGKTKGAGALPYTNKIIDIHNHLKNKPIEPDSPTADDGNNTDDSTSYIYGDEDAEHHKLPEYSPMHQTKAQFEFHQFNQQRKPTTIKEDEEETQNGHRQSQNGHNYNDTIQIVTTKVGSGDEEDPEISFDLSMDSDCENCEDDPARNMSLPPTVESVNGSLNVEVESVNGSLCVDDIRGNFPGSRMSIKTHSAASEEPPDELPPHHE